MDLNKWINQSGWVLFHPQLPQRIDHKFLHSCCIYADIEMCWCSRRPVINYWSSKIIEIYNLYGFDRIWEIELSSISLRWILPDFVNTADYWCRKDNPASVLIVLPNNSIQLLMVKFTEQQEATFTLMWQISDSIAALSWTLSPTLWREFMQKKERVNSMNHPNNNLQQPPSRWRQKAGCASLGSWQHISPRCALLAASPQGN